MSSVTAARIKRTARLAELEHGSGGTGYTILKMRPTPVCRMVDDGTIGPEQLWAATDIELAFHAIAGALALRSPCIEKIDHGVSEHTPAYIIDSVTRYKGFAAYWAKRRTWGDRTFEAVIMVVVDRRPFSVVEIDLGLRHGKAKAITAAGLGDYAARAGVVRGELAQRWLDAAERSFPIEHPVLRMARLEAMRTKPDGFVK
jgi:hypothetical protein